MPQPLAWVSETNREQYYSNLVKSGLYYEKNVVI